MNILNDLTAGLESFMDDVSVDVEVKEPEEQAVVEAAAETEESAVDAQEIQAEGDEDAAAAEMIFMQYDELFRMHDYLAEHGADKAFMSLYNKNGEYAQALMLTLPGCESFDVVGDPHSAETLACLEAEKGFFRKIWDWLVKMFKKIAAFVGNLFQSIKLFFTNVNKRIGKLRELYKEREDDPDFKGKFKTCDAGDLSKATGAIGNIAKEAWDRIHKVQAKFDDTINSRMKGPGAGDVSNSGVYTKASGYDSKGQASNASDADQITHGEALMRQLDEVKAVKFDKEITEKDFAWTAVGAELDRAAGIQKQLEFDQAKLAQLKTMSDKLAQLAQGVAQRAGEDKATADAAKEAKKDASAFNKYQSVITKCASLKVKLINNLVRKCQWRILKGGKKTAA